jgi:hypothetical protein
LLASTYAFIGVAHKAQGTVKSTADGTHPTIQFSDDAGKPVEFIEHGFSSNYHNGQQVPVIYDPRAASATSKLDNFLAIWVVPLTELWIGIAFSFWGVFAKETDINVRGID